MEVYKSKQAIRFVTAASLFDGHDAAINIMRRILQASGAEVIHLGHNRSVQEIVDTAIQEDVQGIAISSYQGGHIEYFKYMYDLLQERGAGHIKIFGGGGGVIVEEEIRELEAYGITKIFSPEDGMAMGLQGMINLMMRECDFATVATFNGEMSHLSPSDHFLMGRALTAVEQDLVSVGSGDGAAPSSRAVVIGLTGTGGAGKSTLTDELVRRFVNDFPDLTLAILSIDPTRVKTGGALLGDRIRMNSIYGAASDRVYMRSFATRSANSATSGALRDSVDACKLAGFDVIIIETAGIGQSDIQIAELVDLSIYVMTQEFGAPTQLEKIGMLDVADFVVINKFEKRGSEDALKDVRKQLQRNRAAFDVDPVDMPVFPTMASRFNDAGVSRLFLAVLEKMNADFRFGRTSNLLDEESLPTVESQNDALIPGDAQRYLGDIADTIRRYHSTVEAQAQIAEEWSHFAGARSQIKAQSNATADDDMLVRKLGERATECWDKLNPESRRVLENWDDWVASYAGDTFEYTIRGKTISADLTTKSLSGLKIPRVAVPRIESAGDRIRFALSENLPGSFPFTAGTFPFKRVNEDPTRMFAGEGSPERTNRRFHLVSAGMPAKRLSTAFDSVTLYGFDPHERPDIYGKVGNSGVSICTLDDMKKLYSGFNLCDPATSVSMTINGPAPMLLAMFMNTAIDQQTEFALRKNGKWEAVEVWIGEKFKGQQKPVYSPSGPDGPEEELPPGHDGSGLGMLGVTSRELVSAGFLTEAEYQDVATSALKTVRGTVQADILKEDQAQNTCIFSTEFALRMMGDIQQYFVDNGVRNYYSVSISGYHIAEAGANPISQLAFTLANGFTFAEYYRARGMDIDSFAPNFSFFFSNGLDPEYTVIGRVARRIWAIAMREKYGANERSQKLKYHIQTSGRSLHSKEIQFNDIRTTLQALLAIYDNCNSLHTNAYDEAITTPTEESVRRAMAIQLIINRELGLAKNENPLQGAFIVEELTKLVEEAVLAEFDRLNDRGGVLGAMETMYQRSKIQEESLFYERKKHAGDLPVIGVNTFIAEGDSETVDAPVALMRSSSVEKDRQIRNLRAFQQHRAQEADDALGNLQYAAVQGDNLFESLLEAVRFCSLGQITDALFQVGGQYRRNM